MMRAWVGRIVACALLALTACEDGPTQTYAPKPAPNGGGGSYVAPGTQRYEGDDEHYGGCYDKCICNPDVTAERWKWMVLQPILPPNGAAGIDIAKGDTWAGLTIDEAERYDGRTGKGDDPGTCTPTTCPGTPQGGLCFSKNLGDKLGDGTIVNSFGDSDEVWFDYRIATRKAVSLTLWPGYLGAMTAQTPDAEGHDTWVVQLSPNAITKNGADVAIDWTDPHRHDFDQPLNQIYRASIHAFLPELPLEPVGTTCFDTQRCIEGSFGKAAYFDLPVLGVTLWVDDVSARAPKLSRIDVPLSRTMPFSFAPVLLKLDAEGAIATAGMLQPSKPACTLATGLGFADFLSDCVRITGDATKDKGQLNKLFGSLGHDDETFSFSHGGTTLDFAATTMKDDVVVHVNDVPSNDDVAEALVIDAKTFGPIANDYPGNDASAGFGALDLHGFGAVQREYLRLVRADLLTLRGEPDGDTAACVFPVGWQNDPTFDAAAFRASMPAWCTGMEGMITTSASTGATDRNDLGMTATTIAPGGLKTGLRPGHPKVVICDDANGDLAAGYASCVGGDVFHASFARVVQVFGRGDARTLPEDARDVRFYWKEWARALVAYFLVATDPTHVDLSDVSVDPDRLAIGVGAAGDFARYVDRRFVDDAHAPLVVEIDADVAKGTIARYTFRRHVYRGEHALIAATTEDATRPLGADDGALLTNVFGSPVLAAGWADATSGERAYECATTRDPKACDGQTCPLDASGSACLLDPLGRPILAGYRGAIGATSKSVFTLSLAKPVAVSIASSSDADALARIDVPRFTDPFDDGSAPLDPLEVTVRWRPKDPTVGFPVAKNGEIDEFVSAALLSLGGATLDADVFEDVYIDPTTRKPDKDGRLAFKAVRSRAFFGDVFLCQDPASGDLLRARMDAPASVLLDWIASHPGSYGACGLVMRTSPFGTALDAVTSLVSGVRIGFDHRGGAGRVVEATLFVPGQ